MDGAHFLRESVGLKLVRQHLSTHWDELQVKVYRNDTDHVMDNYTLRKPNPASMMPMAMASEVGRDSRGGRISGTWRWSEILQLDAGFDGSINVHDDRIGGPPGSPLGHYQDAPWTRDARMQDMGAFGEMRWTFKPHQRLIAGARVDRADTRGYTLKVGSTSGGMGGMPSTTTVVANRASTLPAAFARYERDLDAAPATFYAGLGHVQLDIGLQYRDKGMSAWVSGYLGMVDDFILIRYPATRMGTGSAANVQVRIAGGEAGITYRLTDNWKADATLAYVWGENRTERRPLPQQPPLDLRLGLAYDRPDWSVFAWART